MKAVGAVLNVLAAIALTGLVYGVYQRAVRCPCPAPDGACQTPCHGCCDDESTPEVEPCPCDPTAAQ